MGRLENMGPRVKTDVRIPEVTAELMDKVSRWLGVPKNALVILGTQKLIVELLPVLPARKRRSVVEKMEAEINSMIEAVKKGL